MQTDSEEPKLEMPKEQYNLLLQTNTLIASYTVVIVADPECGITKAEFSSGVRLRIKNHLFVVSAKHCFRTDTNEERPITILDAAGTFGLPAKPTRIIQSRGHPNRDIGYIEIHNDPKIAAASIDSVTETFPDCPSLDPLPKSVKLYILIGIPLTDGSGKRVLPSPFEPINFIQPIPKLEQRIILLRCISANDDLYCFEYPEDSVTFNPVTIKPLFSRFPTSPVGFSGCGIWNSKRHEDRINNVIKPDDMVWLYAIQSRVAPEREDKPRHLQAIPIIHCIRMIHKHYEDLRDDLEGKFPSLKEN
jgi:hypothetical protein